MRPVKYADFPKQDNCYATSFPLTDFSSQFYKERLHVPPLDIGTDRTREDDFQCSLVLSSQRENGTAYRYLYFSPAVGHDSAPPPGPMAAMGLRTSLASLRCAGAKPLKLAGALFICLALGGYGVNVVVMATA